jgi:GNAT superfamily N-acetyltransferase
MSPALLNRANTLAFGSLALRKSHSAFFCAFDMHKKSDTHGIYYVLRQIVKIMKIVKASKKNLVELSKLQKKYMEHHRRIDDYFAFIEDVSRLWIEYAEKVIEDKEHVAYCAVVEGKIVGYMIARIELRPPIYKTVRVGLIGDAYVFPEYRRQGVFTMLLEKTLDWMKKKGVSYVEHPVASRNRIGLKAWKDKGFKEFMIFTRKKI